MSFSIKALAVMFSASAVIHFVRPETFESAVPTPLPKKRELVYVSGVAEVACAAMLVYPRTRRIGGLLSAGLLAAIFPANVQMTVSALGSSRASTWYKIATILRLPLQYPLIRAALKASRA